MIKKVVILSLVLMISVTNILSKEMNILDFDIGGIKLKMDPKTVIEKLKLTYNLKDEDILVLENGSFGKIYHNGMDLSKARVFKQAERGKSPDFYVNFCIAEDTHKAEVRTVEYSIPDTKENRKKMYDMAIQKYGKASFSSMGNKFHTWCDGNKTTHIISSTYACTKNKPLISLNLRYSNISISSDECMLNNIKIREKRKITTPKF